MPKDSSPLTVTVTTSLTTATPIQLTDQVLGEMVLGATDANGITALTWYAAQEYDGEYCIAYEVGTNGVQTVAAGRAYRFPLELAGAAWVKVTGNTGGAFLINFKS